jgi:hypothetical protein
MAEGLSKALGREVKPWSTLPLNDAASRVFAEFTTAVKEGGGPTVGLPVQHWVITANGPIRLHSVSLSLDNQMEVVTLNGRLPVVIAGVPPRVAQDWSPRAAVQLFD